MRNRCLLLFVKPRHGKRRDENVIIRDGKKQWRRIRWHRRRFANARINADRKIRSALCIVLYRCGDGDASSGRKARDSDALRIKAPFGPLKPGVCIVCSCHVAFSEPGTTPVPG